MFSSIVSLCVKQGLLRKLAFPKLKLEQLKIGPTGHLLLQNLKNEWFNNLVIGNEMSVFHSGDDFEHSFQFAKEMCLEKLPFGISEVVNNKKPSSDKSVVDYYNEKIDEKDMDFREHFGNVESSGLKCSIFTCSSDAVTLFYKWQRDRRIWWRKFSPNPGRYSTTDIKTDENGVQSVHIVAEYPWNTQLLETLTLYPKPSNINQSEKFKQGKKTIECQSIVSYIDINTLFLNTICDAYDESDYKDFKRVLLRFHRKLAPYSISFSISSGGLASTQSELNDLALYLTKQLRSKQVSTLLLPSSTKLTLEAQWRQYDQLGVPYNVILNEKTLKDGLLLLRNRDTTLKEQVHVSELVSYVEQLFKNY